MQRFIRERKTSYLRNVIISVLIFLLIFAGFGCGLTAMNKKMDQEEMQTLQNAITRSVTRFVQNEFTDRDELRCFLMAVSGIYRIQ